MSTCNIGKIFATFQTKASYARKYNALIDGNTYVVLFKYFQQSSFKYYYFKSPNKKFTMKANSANIQVDLSSFLVLTFTISDYPH